MKRLSKVFTRLFTRRASPAWNRAYGIDPQITIADIDVNAVEEKYYGFNDERASNRALLPKPPTWVLVAPFLPAVLTFIAGIVAVQYFHAPKWIIAVSFLLTLIMFFAGGRWIVRSYFGPLFRRELRLRGYEICEDCGYWLRGLHADTSRCPECGKPVRTRLADLEQ